MERFRGILHIRMCNVGSRSEGRYPYLVCEDMEYELCREGGLPFNDPYYEPYDDKEVDICGYVSHDALVVESISVATAEGENEDNAEGNSEGEGDARDTTDVTETTETN